MPLEYYFMLAGLVLLLIEFVVPGFGIFGVSGMVCLTVGGFYVLGGNAWAALVLLAVYLFWCWWLPCCACICPEKASIIPLCCGRAKRTAKATPAATTGACWWAKEAQP